MRVIGTAGHVDHGKSTLVQALTGIDPDRLAEEKRRGMTIDLGFAWIQLPQRADSDAVQHVGIVDVPGHIDFIKNMLAGVGSVDAAVLVIAATESVMAQTREHLAILDLLAVPACVVALTKIDLIQEADWLELVELDVQELLASTRFAGAPIVPVSALTGAGLDDLRRELALALQQLPARRDRARPRLPVDRSFSLSGFGTVVTGTLSDGHFHTGDEVELLPQGLRGRIRGMQSYHQAVEEASPGSRVAVNLTGIGVDEIHRGDTLTHPSSLRTTLLVDALCDLLPGAPRGMTHNMAVDFFSGAAEIPARVRLLGKEEVFPGQRVLMQLRLEHPGVMAAGDRFILRLPSPSATLGGGYILDPHPRRRWRRFNPDVLARLAVLARGAPDEILLQTLERRSLITSAQLIEQSGLGVEPAQEALDELLAAGSVVSLPASPQPVLLTVGGWTHLLSQMEQILARYHRQNPLRQGIARGELRNRLQTPGAPGQGGEIPVRLFNLLLERAEAGGRFKSDERAVWLADFAITYTPAQTEAVRRLDAAYAQAGFAPPNGPDTLQLAGGDQELLDSLLEQGVWIRLADGVFLRREEFAAAVTQVQRMMGDQGPVTLAQVRDHLGASRKVVQALLEEMDARRITRREGDARVLR